MKWLKDHYHDVALVFWFLMIPPTLTVWADSILLVNIMSLYACIWISLEVKMQKEDK